MNLRPYSTEAPSKGSNNALLYAAGAAAAGGAGYYYFASSGAAQKAEAKVASGPPKKAFTGGDQGFVSLELKEVEDLSHNAKRFRFKLPEDDMVSGMTVTSAILTKFKDPAAEKPVIRPYTFTSDEGKSAPTGHAGRAGRDHANHRAACQTPRATLSSSSRSTPTAPCRLTSTT